MNLFTMIVLIVAIGALSKAYRHRMTTGADDESKATIDYLKKHVQQLENRMTNVETIVIDEEKEKRFAGL